MIDSNDKINILDKRVEDLNILYNAILIDIKRIEDGMEDPDLSIEELQKILPDIQAKINALLIEKQGLSTI